MILILVVTSTAQEQIIREALANRHTAVEPVTYFIKQQLAEQLLGRDSIAHHARRQIQLGFQHLPTAMIGLGLAAGVDMTPEGTFLVCAAMAMTRSGRQVVGWSTPRLIPETIGRDLSKGGNLDKLIQTYRQQWKPVDIFSQIDIDELINRQASYGEAVAAALDGIFQGYQISPTKL